MPYCCLSRLLNLVKCGSARLKKLAVAAKERAANVRMAFRMLRAVCEPRPAKFRACRPTLVSRRNRPDRSRTSTARRPLRTPLSMSGRGQICCQRKSLPAWLGISVSSFYDWLNQSDRGEFAIRGEPVTIDYFQTGRKGQGRILLESDEVQRIQIPFRVRRKAAVRRQPTRPRSFPGITVKLGRPN